MPGSVNGCRHSIDVCELRAVGGTEKLCGPGQGQAFDADDAFGAHGVLRHSDPADVSQAEEPFESWMGEVLAPRFGIVGKAFQDREGVTGIDGVACFLQHFPVDGLSQVRSEDVV